jgi:hypothetical protein
MVVRISVFISIVRKPVNLLYSTNIGRDTISRSRCSQHGQPKELDRLLDEMMVAEDITRDVDDFESFIRTQPIKIEGSPLI